MLATAPARVCVSSLDDFIRGVHMSALLRALLAQGDKVLKAAPQSFGPAGAQNGVIIDARGLTVITVVAPPNASVDVTRVDDIDGNVAAGLPAHTYNVAAGMKDTRAVDWPFYKLAIAGGDGTSRARVAVL